MTTERPTEKFSTERERFIFFKNKNKSCIFFLLQVFFIKNVSRAQKFFLFESLHSSDNEIYQRKRRKRHKV